jgi:hypothetical protein
MSLFSQRKGITPLKKPDQLNTIDGDLKNSLWNAIDINLWHSINTDPYGSGNNARKFDLLFSLYWLYLFKEPIDTRPKNFESCIQPLRNYFFQCKWHEVYDFIEFTLKYCPDGFRDNLKNWFNRFMEQENSGYRIVNNEVVEITSDTEIKEIEEALRSPLDSVRNHLDTAIAHLSSRDNPDYRNSVKESISAVEALARAVSQEPKATLGQLIKTLESHAGIHPALKSAFSSLYGYTSDEGGIRHSLLQEAKITKTEAAFMLVACSAFVNYVVSKAAEKGIKIKKLT